MNLPFLLVGILVGALVSYPSPVVMSVGFALAIAGCIVTVFVDT